MTTDLIRAASDRLRDPTRAASYPGVTLGECVVLVDLVVTGSATVAELAARAMDARDLLARAVGVATLNALSADEGVLAGLELAAGTDTQAGSTDRQNTERHE